MAWDWQWGVSESGGGVQSGVVGVRRVCVGTDGLVLPFDVSGADDCFTFNVSSHVRRVFSLVPTQTRQTRDSRSTCLCWDGRSVTFGVVVVLVSGRTISFSRSTSLCWDGRLFHGCRRSRVGTDDFLRNIEDWDCGYASEEGHRTLTPSRLVSLARTLPCSFVKTELLLGARSSFVKQMFQKFVSKISASRRFQNLRRAGCANRPFANSFQKVCAKNFSMLKTVLLYKTCIVV